MMIYDVYCMAVLYKLRDGPQPRSSLYHTSNQHGKLNDMMDMGLVCSGPEGIGRTYLGERTYEHLYVIADMLNDTSYIDKAAHIDKMNRRRLESMRKKP